MMTLKENQEALLLYYYGEEGAPSESDVQQWLEEDPTLNDYLETLGLFNDDSGILDDEKPDGEFTAKALERIEQEKRDRLVPFSRKLLTLAAVLLLSLIGWQAMVHFSHNSTDKVGDVVRVGLPDEQRKKQTLFGAIPSERVERLSKMTSRWSHSKDKKPARLFGRLSQTCNMELDMKSSF